MVLASDFDKSKYLRAEDLKSEKKFRIKAVTVEVVGTGSEREQKLVVWFTNEPHPAVERRQRPRCGSTTATAATDAVGAAAA